MDFSDDVFTPEELEQARKLFAGPCDFVMGVAEVAQFPETHLPEIAFAGRSNAGKSSLVNALTGRKSLARTSNTPGRTQQLNYFNLGGRLHLVDMPGYGYAKVSYEQKDEWDALVLAYLRGRSNLRCVFMLMDARHGLKDVDRGLMKMLDKSGVSYRIVLTKSDKIKTKELEKTAAETLAELKDFIAAFPGLQVTSAVEQSGLDELRVVIATYAD